MDDSKGLYIFATELELFGVFPDLKFQNSLPKNKLFSLPHHLGYASVLGIGVVEFSVNLAFLLEDCKRHNLSIQFICNLGICGAYPNSGLNILDVVRIDKESIDLGYQNADGSLGSFSQKTLLASPVNLAPLNFNHLKSASGLTVNCCTGTVNLAEQRSKFFNAQVESMEGYAGFYVAQKWGIPIFQIRSISNIATTRDKSKWQINEALVELQKIIKKQNIL